jgi:hypothetical protein
MPIGSFETFDMRSPQTAHVKRLVSHVKRLIRAHVKRLTVDNLEGLHVKRLVFLLTDFSTKTNAALSRNAWARPYASETFATLESSSSSD